MHRACDLFICSGNILDFEYKNGKSKEVVQHSLYLLKGIQVNLARELRIILVREKSEFCKVTFVSKQGYFNQDINDNSIHQSCPCEKKVQYFVTVLAEQNAY